MKQHYEKDPNKGYRRLADDLAAEDGIKINNKRALRIAQRIGIKADLKYPNDGCTRPSKRPAHVAENILNRDFHADCPDEKWVTDVTEFKYGTPGEEKKLYLSTILDLYGRLPIASVLSDHNDTLLALDTFDLALEARPDAHPLFHTDRGYQYTSHDFYNRLKEAGMTQSMSRPGKCIDNGAMEGFWGILKREMYYKRHFDTREELETAIMEYIDYYTNKRIQHKLGRISPMAYYGKYQAVA